MSKKLFKYDVVTLIELIESKPCLWDKTADSFKDRVEKQNAWKEVYTFLEEDYLEKDKKDQQKIGKISIYYCSNTLKNTVLYFIHLPW